MSYLIQVSEHLQRTLGAVQTATVLQRAKENTAEKIRFVQPRANALGGAWTIGASLTIWHFVGSEILMACLGLGIFVGLLLGTIGTSYEVETADAHPQRVSPMEWLVIGVFAPFAACLCAGVLSSVTRFDKRLMVSTGGENANLLMSNILMDPRTALVFRPLAAALEKWKSSAALLEVISSMIAREDREPNEQERAVLEDAQRHCAELERDVRMAEGMLALGNVGTMAPLAAESPLEEVAVQMAGLRDRRASLTDTTMRMYAALEARNAHVA